MQSMKVLDANMPRRSTDVDSGAIRVATWARMFGHMPRQQVEFMCRQALTRHTFFPTIAEFTAIAEEWERSDGATREQRLARIKFESEQQARRSEARKRLKFEQVPQSEIDAMPEWLREDLHADRVLVRCECGSYAQHGHWREFEPMERVEGEA